jgi:hypothetical protein
MSMSKLEPIVVASLNIIMHGMLRCTTFILSALVVYKRNKRDPAGKLLEKASGWAGCHHIPPPLRAG